MERARQAFAEAKALAPGVCPNGLARLLSVWVGSVCTGQRVTGITRWHRGRGVLVAGGRLVPRQAPASGPYPFNSCFSSLKKRQSVPWAMSFFGEFLIMPVSCRRSA